MPTSAASRSTRKLVPQQPRRSKKTALRLHFSTDSVTETDRPVTPRPASRSSAPLVEITLLSLATWIATLTQILVEDESCANDSAFYDLLTGILKSLALLQGSDVEKSKVVFLAGLLFSRLWTNASEIPEVHQAIQASYQASGSHIIDIWTALMQIILNRNPASSPRLKLQTPKARIEFLYLLKPARDACIKILGEDSHIVASDWLLWLNQNILLVESDPASLSGLFPLINQLSTEAGYIVDNDTTTCTSSPIVSLQVELPAEEQDFIPYPASSSGSDSDSTASDGVMDSRLNTPQAHPVALVQSPSPKRPPTVLSLHIPSPPPISECPTPSSIMSIPDYDDDNWSVAVDIDSVPPSQLPVSSPTVPVRAPSPVEVEMGSVSSTSSNGGAPSKLLYTVPLPFIDDSQRVVATVPLRAPRPMNMLPGWWC